MIPATFDYVRAESIDHAVATLAEHGDEAKLLAGGHSLLPLMKLRLAAPEVLVDLGRIGALRGVSESDDHLVIGAMTRHQDVIDDPLVREHCGVLAHVTEMVGDAQVRHRGTIGGAVAHGDAAGDLPAVALALDATFVVQGPDARREVAAADFFVDYLDTAVGDDEVLTEIRVPKLDEGWRWRYEKFVRVSQAWAIVGALALVRRENGSIGEARVALTNMATVPVRARGVESALAGAGTDAIDAAAQAAAEGTSPSADLNASAEYREHLARVLTRRAVEAAAT
ncbi:MAG: xanthine dehydrogenase family protein subunit M [Egicoccus sp.]